MFKKRAAVIGCGTIFPMHALSIKALEEVELVIVDANVEDAICNL